jgi:hypothetical protein
MYKGLAIVYKLNVYFYIAQHIRDIALLENLVTYFNSGLVEKVQTRPTKSYVVYILYDVFKKIPFFETYPIFSKKKWGTRLDFYDFKKIANITEKTLNMLKIGIS